MTTPITGGCLCGALRYAVTAEPAMTFLCQCRDCQRFTGSGHAAAMIVPRAAVQLAGQATFYQSPTDSGHVASRGFCARCGSSVYAGTSGVPDILAIMAGTLDEPSRYRPQAVIYHVRAASWDLTDASLPKFAKMPPPAPPADAPR